MIRDGKLTRGTLVWTKSMADWAPAGSVSDLADAPVKGDRPFEVSMLFAPVVLRRWAIAVVLHGLWHTSIQPLWIKWIVLSVVGWYFVLGILTQALDEVALEKKKAVAA